jgi:hypothetical protein
MVNQENSACVEEIKEDHCSVEVLTPIKGDFPQNNDSSIKKFIHAAVLIVLMILVLLATFSFFFNMLEAIAALINPKYQALVQALFSLLVLVIGIYTIKRFLSNKSW